MIHGVKTFLIFFSFFIAIFINMAFMPSIFNSKYERTLSFKKWFGLVNKAVNII